MPKLSDGMEEGTLVAWLAEDGAEVARGQELAEIETDKATMVYEAEEAGILRVLVAAGESVPVGAPIAALGDGVEPPPAPAAVAVAGNGGGGATLVPPAPAPAPGQASRAPARVKASPVARRIAATLGIDLAALVGSGPRGRVVKRDVEQAAATPAAVAPAPAAAAPAPAPEPVPATTGARGQVVVEEPTRLQRTVARRMAEAKSTQPEFTLTVDVDMDAAVELRQRFRALGGDGPIPSYNDLVVKAAALALRARPEANGAWVGDRIERWSRVNVGVAVAAEGSLTVPTVFDADTASLGRIAAETRRLAGLARDGALTPEDLSGGTFTVSNLGMFGISSFTAVLNPPQAGILAVGALEERPVVRDGALAVGRRMTLTLTSDHRVLYGADAAALLSTIRAGLEAPLRLAL